MVHPTYPTTNPHPMANSQRRSVGVFPNRQAAEQALHELRDSGFPMERVSVVTRDNRHHDEIAGAEVHERTSNKADEGAAIGALSGGTLGGLAGLLVGLGTLAIPGMGPIMLAGATATALATTLAGGTIGAVSGGLLGALIGLGIPEERARVYHDHIARGGYIVIIDGTNSDIATAEAILHRRGIEEYGVYDAPIAHTATSFHPASGEVSATHPVTRPATHSATHSATHGATTTYSATPSHASSVLPGRQTAVGFFSDLSDTEYAVTDLRSVGFPLSQITLVANYFRRRDQFTDVTLRDRFESARLGIPAEQARFYQDRLGRGEYMVIVHGTADQLNRAATILNHRNIEEWRIYDPTVVTHEWPVEASRETVVRQ